MKTKPELRKATMKKNTPYKFGKRLSKGDKVLIQETFMGRGRVCYTAVKPDDNSIMAMNVTASMFEYTDKIKFVVHVIRTSYSYQNIEVEATTREEAKHVAIDTAGGLEFSEKDAEYEANSVMTKSEHNNLFK